MKNYFKLFPQLGINSDYSKKILRRFKYALIYRNIINIIFLIPWIILLFEVMTKGIKNDGGAFFILGLATMFVYLPLITLYFLIRNRYEGHLEQIYFDEFLSKKLRIFYHIEELSDFTYEIIKDITKSANLTNNNMQALIFACQEAYELGAEGVFVVGNQQSSITSGKTDKRGKGSVQTTVLGTTSVRALKNIREKPKNSISNEVKDLEYWFGMLEKGAITKEEYEKKKMELLS